MFFIAQEFQKFNNYLIRFENFVDIIVSIGYSPLSSFYAGLDLSFNTQH